MNVFNQFKDIISKYNSRLLLRVRPKENVIIENVVESPYEIHLIEFASEINFTNFLKDEDRKRFLHLKKQSIKSVLLIKDEELK